jgi:hypothetical protein
LRTSFCVPVWQKEQVSVQPTCEDAQRAAIFLGDIDGFDLVPAGDAQQIFAGAVGADLAGHDLGQGDLEPLGQKGAVILGQIGHLREIAHAPVIDPLPDLADAHLGLPLGRAGGDQRLDAAGRGSGRRYSPAPFRAACAEWSAGPA